MICLTEECPFCRIADPFSRRGDTGQLELGDSVGCIWTEWRVCLSPLPRWPLSTQSAKASPVGNTFPFSSTISSTGKGSPIAGSFRIFWISPCGPTERKSTMQTGKHTHMNSASLTINHYGYDRSTAALSWLDVFAAYQRLAARTPHEREWPSYFSTKSTSCYWIVIDAIY